MGFWASSFQFDGIPSETYNLTISNGLSSSTTNAVELNTNGSNDVKLLTETLLRRPQEVFYFAEQFPVLEFDASITANTKLTAKDGQLAQKWLFGRQIYKPLQIMQDDMQDVYYNCFLIKPLILRVGNEIVGFDFTVHCDTPFGAKTFPKTLSYSYGDDVISTSFNFFNDTDNNYYSYPSLSITMNNIGGNITLTNVQDNNRQFQLTGLLANEVITINNDLQIITSSLGIQRLGNFNLNWFRLLPNLNTINSSRKYFKFIYDLLL